MGSEKYIFLFTMKLVEMLFAIVFSELTCIKEKKIVQFQDNGKGNDVFKELIAKILL